MGALIDQSLSKGISFRGTAQDQDSRHQNVKPLRLRISMAAKAVSFSGS